MNKREILLNYIKNGGRSICSPQIGAGAGFDTKLAGKEWISDTTIEDTLNAVTMFDIVPLINVGCPFEMCLPELRWQKVVIENTEDKRIIEHYLITTAGTLLKRSCETRRNSPFNLKYAITKAEDLYPFELYLRELLSADFSMITNFTRSIYRDIDGRAALSIQWPVQPYELLCFPDTVDTVLLAHDCPEYFFKLMDMIVIIDEKLMKAVSEGGADFIFLGAPSAEMLSPLYYEKFIIPYSKIVTEIAHKFGLLVYSHICSPIEPFLSMGYYNRMGIDLFETLSPPPVGNIYSLNKALKNLDERICTRGNIGLDILLNAEKDEVKRIAKIILQETKGRKHILAASDYLFYETPPENVNVMVEAVNESF